MLFDEGKRGGMRCTSFRLLVGSSRRPAMAHGATALGVVAAPWALEEEDGGGWVGRHKAIGLTG
jgi:hypothetical protein